MKKKDQVAIRNRFTQGKMDQPIPAGWRGGRSEQKAAQCDFCRLCYLVHNCKNVMKAVLQLFEETDPSSPNSIKKVLDTVKNPPKTSSF